MMSSRINTTGAFHSKSLEVGGTRGTWCWMTDEGKAEGWDD